MKRWLGILLLVLTIACSWGMANDYVDDVYVWIPKTASMPTTAHTTQRVDVSTAQPAEQPTFTIEFLDDSITRQNPDTVVRAIIRR
ncbi:MAG: hypothetical protein MJZ88_04745 [Paludibacteraceae bacterium]|nr:hypothetical protein [Paludibacteraceae bacterium]